jgi:5-methylcytosine-specific restriction endonuclease McrA
MSPILTICPAPRCGRLTTPGQRHCPQHAARTAHTTQTRNLNRRARDRRNTRHWQKIRALVIARDEATCQRCGQPGRSVHYLPGGQHSADLDDYVTLCTRCHGAADGARPRVFDGGRFEL